MFYHENSHETTVENSSLCDGHWHNVLMTWQGTSQEWRVYIDQTLASEGTIDNSPTTALQRGLVLTIGPDVNKEGK